MSRVYRGVSGQYSIAIGDESFDLTEGNYNQWDFVWEYYIGDYPAGLSNPDGLFVTNDGHVIGGDVSNEGVWILNNINDTSGSIDIIHADDYAYGYSGYVFYNYGSLRNVSLFGKYAVFMGAQRSAFFVYKTEGAEILDYHMPGATDGYSTITVDVDDYTSPVISPNGKYISIMDYTGYNVLLYKGALGTGATWTKEGHRDGLSYSTINIADLDVLAGYKFVVGAKDLYILGAWGYVGGVDVPRVILHTYDSDGNQVAVSAYSDPTTDIDKFCMDVTGWMRTNDDDPTKWTYNAGETYYAFVRGYNSGTVNMLYDSSAVVAVDGSNITSIQRCSYDLGGTIPPSSIPVSSIDTYASGIYGYYLHCLARDP